MTVFQNIRKGLIPARLTVDEVFALTESGVIAESENIELIDGKIVPMAAAKASAHERMKSRLIEWLVMRKPRELGVYAESSLALDAGTLVEPDIAVWPRDLASRDARGPDVVLLIEVADSSLSYDIHVKAPLYARYGVRDYWVVDAVRQTIRIHRAPEDGMFTDVEEYEAHNSVAPLLLPGITLRLDTLD
ncbi:Uma2 family endonuclease [Sphingomonas baiyangensis]|uniref:Uma2 family endonuclease n=1 Tax=Sphingomonas baiyangensis TaxID=2572576 RepID=A0A4U1L6D4_9SPHN|nr:Uma2 family endonuclease [Sphingomonas baiyangensis]TKD51786.1 Uma2 family endonuclease [Sphingomonas baiyangensis]